MLLAKILSLSKADKGSMGHQKRRRNAPTENIAFYLSTNFPQQIYTSFIQSQCH